MNGDRFFNVSTEWSFKTLSECTEDGVISYGIVQPGQHQQDGVPIVRVNNLRDDGFEFSDIMRVSPEIESKFKRTRIKEGDVLLTLVGSTGISQIAHSKMNGWNVARAIAVIRPLESIGSEWINICLQTKEVKYFLDSRANTTVQKTLNLKDVKEIIIPIPPDRIKNQIVEINKHLNDKIALNRQINQTLEAMAQALFKSWFVDFEPVRAKIAALETGEDPTQAAMRTISGKTDDELAHWETTNPDDYAQLHATASLFPEALTESELGLVPEGWEVKPFGDTITLIGGGTPKRTNAEFWDGDIPWFSIRDIPDAADIFVVDTDEKITKAGLDGSSTRLLKKGTVIITARGTVGKIAVVGTPMAMNQSCYGVVNKEYFAPILTYYRIKQAVSILQRNTHGAVFDTITKDTFNTFYSIVPPKDIADAFQHGVFPVFYQVDSNVHDNRTLASLRDTLLPKLLSGELTVGESKKP